MAVSPVGVAAIVAPAIAVTLFAGCARAQSPSIVRVSDELELRQAVSRASAGTVILVAPGQYAGGFYFEDLRGEPGRPVVIAAENPFDPPVFRGGTEGMHLVNPAYVELRHLTFVGARANGLNIDDGGTMRASAHHIVLQGIRVTDVGPSGNRDGLKLSGVRDFRIEDCVIERWGDAGQAIDLVGAHDGLITGCVIRQGGPNAAGVQAKGGSSRIVVRGNRFERAGGRAVNIGGSTGPSFFRPPLEGDGPFAEARDIVVEGNLFIGGAAPVAYVGVDGAIVRYNTIYRPERWVLRILQETRLAGFVPSRNGVFAHNVVVFRT
ncbi:MAG TPA: right-handed parallel beta-helix repeat-containing protein, partial [Limnochordia bacterium]